jgi:hypothetical protein
MVRWTDWVNAEIVHYESDFSENTNGWNVTDGSLSVSDGAMVLAPNTSSTTHFANRSSSLPVGKKLRVTFDVKIPSGQSIVTGFRATEVSGALIKYVTSQTQGEFVSYSEEITPTNTGLIRFFAATNTGGGVTFSGNDSEKLIIKNIVVTVIDDDGHVSTWYDQSGSDNHAVQTDTAKQPKIVEGGTLLKDSNNNPEVVFTRGDAQFLTASSPIAFNDVFFKFRRTDATNATNGILTEASSGVYPYTYIHHSSQTFSFDGNASDTVNLSFNGQYEENQSTDKGGLVTIDDHLVYLNYTSNPDAISDIGKLYNGSPIYGSFGAGEFIFYDSDQSTKRRAIEENIANHYDISLAAFSRDGTVKTWYDQSETNGVPNANHAVQTDPTKQPKIVVNGNLLEDGVTFDEANETELKVTGDPVITADYTGTYSAFSIQKISNSESGYLYGNASPSDGSSIYNNGSNYAATNKNNAALDEISKTSSKNLLSAVYNNGDAGLLVNGDGTMVDQGTYDFNAGTSDFIIGNRNGGSEASHYLDGTIAEIIIYNSDQSTKRRAIEENIANHYNISLAAFSRDGTVSTWYDQSGSDNHATQTDPTKQPKIVDGGSLLKLNGKPSIDFSTVDGYLELSQEVDTSNKPCSIIAATEPTNKALIGQTSNRRLVFNSSDARFGLSVSAITEDYPSVSGGAVFTAIHNGTTTAPNVVIYANGSASTTNDSNQGSPMTVGVIDFIGVNLGSAVISYFDKKLPEVIIYNSDQTANRTAIEANIGETYGITAIPAANDTVNGFVQTWYDQSGSGNDAEQTTASKQPKIVVNGTYLGEIKFENGLYVQKTGLSLSGPFSTFSLSNANSQHNGALLNFGTSFSQQYRSNLSLLLQYGDTNFSSAGAYTVGEQNVMSFIFDTTGLGYYNGTEVINDATTGATATQFRVGNSPFGLDGDVKEIIIYNSNQSANRPAIEANIANQYGITLS